MTRLLYILLVLSISFELKGQESSKFGPAEKTIKTEDRKIDLSKLPINSSKSSINLSNSSVESNAQELMTQVSEQLELQHKGSFKYHSVTHNNQTVDYKYSQLKNGLYIAGAETIVSIDEKTGKIVDIKTRMVDTIDLDSTPKLSKQEAIAKIDAYMSDDTIIGYHEYWHYRVHLDAFLTFHLQSNNVVKLKWVITTMINDRPILPNFEIDAHSGEIIKTMNLKAFAPSSSSMAKV